MTIATINLSDTLNTWRNQANSAITEVNNLNSIIPQAFTGNSGKIVVVKDTEDGFELESVSGNPLLSDDPSDYGKGVIVDSNGESYVLTSGKVADTSISNTFTEPQIISDDVYARITLTNSTAVKSGVMNIGTTGQMFLGTTNSTDLILVSGTGQNRWFIDGTDGGLYSTNAIGGSKGEDTINASELYEDNERVVIGSRSNIFTADQTIRSTDSGSSLGPALTIDRDSASPADNDLLGSLILSGRNSTDAQTTYGRITAKAIDVTNGTEDGSLIFTTIIAGILADRVVIKNGIYGSGTTGGDKGSNTANFTTIYENNVSLTDKYALSTELTNTISNLGDLASEDDSSGVPYNNSSSNLDSTNVKNALDELDDEKLSKSSNLSDVPNKATAFNTIKQSATTSASGVVEEAIKSEMEAGTNGKFPDCETVKNFATARAYFREQQSANVPSTSPSDSGWNTIVLNTERLNNISGASINTSTSVFTLPAGKYMAKARVPWRMSGSASSCGSRLRIRDSADTTTYALGQANILDSDYDSTEYGHSHLTDYFTLSSSKSLILQQYFTTSSAGIGYDINQTDDEVFGEVELLYLGT